MIWLNPAAWIALAAVAAPILIHILVQRRAERFPFPSLRFIAPTRLAAVRRRMLEDVALLTVRVLILAAVVAALAGPLVLTAARRHAWDQRVVRAIVVDVGPDVGHRFSGADLLSGAGANPSDTPFRQQRFDGASLADGVRRAVAWLDTAPPARREIVVVSPFAIGSLTAADIALIPAGVGIRLERRGALPASRTVSGGRVLTSATDVVAREATLDGARTVVRETTAAERASWPIDVRAPRDVQPVVDAAVAAVLSQRVLAPPPNRRARLVFPDVGYRFSGAGAGPRGADDLSDATWIHEPWMADAVAWIADDRELQASASRIARGFADSRFTTAPWIAVASAADGSALAVAAGSSAQLIIVSAARATDLVTPLLMRSIVNGLADPLDLQSAEVVPIPDRVLREWSRPAPAPAAPRLETVDEDDRRWLWLAALALLAIEAWMRRARTVAAREDVEEAARVA